MSKFFFKGTIDVMGKYGKSGYSPKRNVKLGSEAKPLQLSVPSEQRKVEIETILLEQALHGQITVNENEEENILELDAVLNKPTTQRFDKVPERNAPCSCGSGKKYKKCCG
ncbi:MULTISPECIES: PBPRA1643 family SWIM/SEC-C metal-binding motif protein [Thalassotalea]|uniref:SEC-C metal-binding domain-containing protein n=1 Tax=Thalassotalea castellviae TaxID=3075612 RepID=A0ABU3A3G3_9GAMM|nr:PBPRA1643 family SWIM/SEC-C metal-binding motif protein [Thalassotalea sp. W431]MDT0604717.1 SEC-C metal-binding domain-containing protein [Thalassotalea sp. W431]